MLNLFSSQEFYTHRNVSILRSYLEKRRQGKTTRLSIKEVANENSLSQGLVHAIVFNRKYPYAAAAWEIIEKEHESLNTL